jgi:hypothetical protein
MKNNIIKNTLSIYAGVLTVFLLIPVFMIAGNPVDYSFIDKTVLLYTSFTYIVVFGTALSVIGVFFEFFKLKKLITFIIYFVFTWIVISGFIMPVAASTGMVDPIENPTNWFNLIAISLLSFVFGIISLGNFQKFAFVFLLTITITSSISPLIYLFNLEVEDDNNLLKNSSLEVSENKNIFIISLDGMPGESVSSIIKSSKDYSDNFKDFIIFNNAVSQSPATRASLTGDIYGIQDYKSKGKSIVQARSQLEKEGLSEHLTHNHIQDSFHYGYPDYGMDEIKIPSAISELFNKEETFRFFHYPIVRIFGSFGVRVLNKINYILSLSDLIIKNAISPELIEKLANNDNGAAWNKGNILTMFIFDSFVSNLSVSKKEISLRYLHIPFSHFPISIDEECNYRSDDKDWHNSNQNEKGIRNNDICAIKKFVAFLDKLKELGIYDNSLIIFKSDHGKPAPYFSSSPNNLRINGHIAWGYNRYRPTLMVKGFGANTEAPVYRDELVLLNDVAKTICIESNIKSECGKFNGVNLLDTILKTNDPYFLYVVKNKHSSFRFDSHISVRIPTRDLTLLEAMTNSNLIELDQPGIPQIQVLKEANLIK